jgi:large subunit ribosomal protein L19
MKNSLITKFEQKVFADRTIHPEFRPGDTVRVHYKIQEGADKTKFRIQAFEGVVLKRKKGTANSSFTVRKIGANSVGVERVFPSYSPFVTKIDVIANGVVRRSRLYYLRGLSGKAARIRSRYLGKKTTTEIPGASIVKEEITPELNPELVKKEAEAAAKAAEAKTAADAPKTDS